MCTVHSPELLRINNVNYLTVVENMDMYPAAIHLYPLYSDIEGIFGIVYSLAKY